MHKRCNKSPVVPAAVGALRERRRGTVLMQLGLVLNPFAALPVASLPVPELRTPVGGMRTQTPCELSPSQAALTCSSDLSAPAHPVWRP